MPTRMIKPLPIAGAGSSDAKQPACGDVHGVRRLRRRPPGPTRCDSKALDGPSKPPADAVTVSTDQSLADVVKCTFRADDVLARAGHPPPWKGCLRPGHCRTPATPSLAHPVRSSTASTQNRYAFGGDAPDVNDQVSDGAELRLAPETTTTKAWSTTTRPSGWTVESSTIQKNAGAGVMLGSAARLIGNCLRDNGQYGFNAYHADGVKDVVLDGNEIAGNNTDDWEKRQPGCGCTGGGKFWETNGAKITNNYVHDNKGVGLWADSNNVGFRFEGNYISDNDAEGIMYETSYNAVIVNNTFVRNALVKGPTNPQLPGLRDLPLRVGERQEGRRAVQQGISSHRATCSPTTGRASWPGRTRTGSPALPPTRAPASARW